MTEQQQSPSVDFNLHGIVTVRFINAPPSLVAAYTHRLGPTLMPAGDQEADIVVNFQDEFGPANLNYVGLNKAAFDDQGFYVLDDVSGVVDARIPFEAIGQRPEILCRRGVKSVPLLSEIILLTFLTKEYAPLHASAFVYDGAGVAVMGWAKGGKTGAMLSFMNHGAEFIGDEWIVLSADGREMLGLPNSVSISEWQLEHIPRLRPELKMQQRFLFKGIHMLESTQRLLERGPFRNSSVTKMLGKAVPPFRRQLKLSKAPQSLFKNQLGQLRARADLFFWIVSHNDPSITVQAQDPQDIARRMAAANQYEQRHFFEYYKAFSYAFPCQRNQFLEQAAALQGSLLSAAFTGKRMVGVSHPYAGPLENLFVEMLDPIQAVNRPDRA